jgi:hypothetical protein
MSKPRSFAQNVALFSLLAPIAAAGFDYFANSLRNEDPLVGRVLGLTAIILVPVGLAASVIALAFIPRLGKTGILWQALGGLSLNGVLMVVMAWVFVLASKGGVPTLDDMDLRQQLIGEWVADKDGVTMGIELRRDGSFRVLHLHSGISVADFSGKWAVQNRDLYLNVDTIVDGNREAIGNKLNWSIDKLERNELVLGWASGQTRYERK